MNKNFGNFGGQYIPEALVKPLAELEKAFEDCCRSEEFKNEYKKYLKEYVGRPSLLYYAERLTKKLGGAKIYLKREDLNHTGAHKINNVIGQILLAKHMGKKRVIAETGAGQHGVATATGAALFGMECTIFMGEEDMRRQELNVFRMRMLGAEVKAVTSGSGTLKEAVDEAFAEYVRRAEDTFYVVGSAVGPHPYPLMVREFQKIIGEEAKAQIMEAEGRLPDYIIACVGGGSNAIGMFHDFVKNEEVKIVGVEAAGRGIKTGEHACAFEGGEIGILHGMKTYVMTDDEGNVKPAYSISAGLDYPGVGPEHAYLRDIGRAKYASVTDDEAMKGFRMLCETEGIIPAIESAHALGYAVMEVPKMKKDEIVIINLSGRGDKDVNTAYEYFEEHGLTRRV